MFCEPELRSTKVKSDNPIVLHTNCFSVLIVTNFESQLENLCVAIQQAERVPKVFVTSIERNLL